MSPFVEYVRHGWALCVIRAGSKKPISEGWNREENVIRDPVRAAVLTGAGLCHRWSGTCALDIDEVGIATHWLSERGVDLARLIASHPVRLDSGRVGRAKLLFALPEWLPSHKTAEFRDPISGETHTALDFRCATKDGLSVQDVLPPTTHPDTGRPYAWGYRDPLFDHWSALPSLPEALRSIWKTLLDTSARPASDGPLASALPEEIEALLAQQNPDAVYNDWIRVGMAVHSATAGSRAGLELWNTWSKKGSKYKGIEDLNPHWHSFQAGAGVTIGALRRDAIATAEDFPEVVDEPAEYAPAEKPPPLDRELARAHIEDRVVYVRAQDSYFDLTSACMFPSDRAMRHVLCPDMPFITGEKGQQERPDPLNWLQFSKTKQTVQQMGFHPGKGRLYEEDKMRFVNLYNPIDPEPLVPLPHEREAFEFLWSQLKEPRFQLWLMQFFAHALQRPGVKIQSAPLLFSAATGSGKNTIAKVIPQLLFGIHNVSPVSGDILASSFTDVLANTWWLYLEELRTGKNKAERMVIGTKLRSWITDDTIPVHPKNFKPFTMRNRVQITATSNYDDAIQVDNNDRRWAVCELRRSMTEQEAVDIYDGFLSTPRAAGVLRHIFANTSLAGFNPAARAPMTESKTIMIRAGLGDWESRIIQAMSNLEAPFNRDLFRLADVIEALPNMPSEHALGRLLRTEPFNCETIREATYRRWVWRRMAFWKDRTPGERDAHYTDGSVPDDAPPALRPDFVEQLEADNS